MSASIGVGIIGALLFGTGMSLITTDLGAKFGLLAEMNMAIGIVVGMVGLCLAYPVYNYVIKKERNKIAPRVLELTEELMK